MSGQLWPMHAAAGYCTAFKIVSHHRLCRQLKDLAQSGMAPGWERSLSRHEVARQWALLSGLLDTSVKARAEHLRRQEALHAPKSVMS